MPPTQDILGDLGQPSQEGRATLQDIIGGLSRRAGLRGYTFAGRALPQGHVESLQSILSQVPTQGAEGEGYGAALLGAGSISGKKVIENLIHQRAQLGAPMPRGSFIPTITLPGQKPLLGSVGGIHADIKLPANVPQGTRAGFATIEGHPLSDEALHLLTGPPQKLQAASALLRKGNTLEDVLKMIFGNAPYPFKHHP